MKYFFLVSAVLLFCYCDAQDSTYNTIKSDVCSCMENFQAAHASLNNSFQTCANEAMEKNALALFQKVQAKYGNPSDENIERFTYSLLHRLMVDMIASCDVYYHMMDTSRLKKNPDKDSLRKILQYRTYTMDRKLSNNFYYYRADVYFQLGDYKHALSDLDSSCIEKPNDSRATTYKAFIMELQHNYNEAVRLYEKAYEVEYNAVTAFLNDHKYYEGLYDEAEGILVELAIAKRKLKENE